VLFVIRIITVSVVGEQVLNLHLILEVWRRVHRNEHFRIHLLSNDMWQSVSLQVYNLILKVNSEFRTSKSGGGSGVEYNYMWNHKLHVLGLCIYYSKYWRG
jgi:hypothetical protein